MISYIYIAVLLLLTSCSSTDFSGATAERNQEVSDDEDSTEDNNETEQDTDIARDTKDEDGFDRATDLFDEEPNDFDIDLGDNDEDEIELDEGQQCRKYIDGFVGAVYRLAPGTGQLPDFSALTPEGEVESLQLDVAPRSWEKGFPGVDNLIEWFAIDYSAELKVETAGRYLFKTHSDDGSKLFINGNVVVDNDGTHSPRTKISNAIELEEGTAEIRIEWFQGPRNQIALQVYWQPPGGSWEIIPATATRQRKNCDLKDLGTFE